jgi:protein TonB
MNILRHLFACCTSVFGAALVLGGIYAMNETHTPPPHNEVKQSVDFKVEKVIKKPKPRPKQTKRKTVAVSNSAPPAPDIVSAISGVSFSLPSMELGIKTGSDILGETKDRLAMTSDSVDQLPKALSRPQVDYPENARKRGITGYVMFKMMIDASGNVQNIKVVESFPKGVFEEKAKTAVKDVRYKPAYYQGEPVDIWVKRKIRFELSKT